MALIKLCRPAMETNLDSLFDRIRVLEKKIEERPVVFSPSASLQTAQNPNLRMDEKPAEEAREPAKAAPEDLKKVVAGWRSIVGETGGMLKQMLKKAIPKYNADTGEPVLFIEFQDFLAEPYVENEEVKAQLTEIIARQTGKKVKIQMLMSSQKKPQGLAEISIEQAMKENIRMDVIVEES